MTMNKNNLSKSNFGTRGWLLILYCLLTFFLTTGSKSTMNVAASIYHEMYGWDVTFLISLSTIGGWITVFFVYLTGVLFANGKVKLRPFILIGGIVYSVTLCLWGVVSDLKVFVFIFVLQCIMIIIWPQFTNNAICSNWFPRKKGLVIGWSTIGLPLGSGVCVVIFNKLLKSVGFKYSYIIFGVAILMVSVFGYLFFRDYPEEIGLYPDNDKNMTREQALAELKAGEEIIAKSPWSAKRMLLTKETWLIGLSCAYSALFATGTMAQMVPRLLAAGYSADVAVNIMAIAAYVACFGSYAFGWIDTKIGPRRAVILLHFFSIAACVFNIIPSYLCMIISVALIGIVLGGGANFLLSATTTYWGRYNFKKAYGTMLTINQIVGQSGAMMIAILAARWGYNVAYVALGALAVVAILLILPVKSGFVERAEERFRMEDEGKA